MLVNHSSIHSADIHLFGVGVHLQRVHVCVAGISMNVQPMYFGESAPKHLRGAISLSSAVFTAFGVVLGQVVGLRCAPRISKQASLAF